MMTRCPEPGCRFVTFAKQASGALALHRRLWHEGKAKRAETAFGEFGPRRPKLRTP